MRWSLFLILLLFKSSLAFCALKIGVGEGSTASKCVGGHPRAGFAFLPNCEEVVTQAWHQSRMSFNAAGLRDKNYSPKPKKGWMRILLVGSSQFVGPGLLDREVVPRRLEALLRKNNPKIELINASVEGYSAIHSALRIQAWVEMYSPTVVILYLGLSGLIANDMMSDLYLVGDSTENYRLDYKVNPKIQLAVDFFGMSGQNWPRFHRVITVQSMLYRMWRSWECKIKSKNEDQLATCLMRRTLTSIKDMKQVIDKSSAKFYVLFSSNKYSNEATLSPYMDKRLARILDFFTPLVMGRPVGPMQLFLKQQRVENHSFFFKVDSEGFLPGDMHLNAHGSDQLARTLLPLVQGFLLKAQN